MMIVCHQKHRSKLWFADGILYIYWISSIFWTRQMKLLHAIFIFIALTLCVPSCFSFQYFFLVHFKYVRNRLLTEVKYKCITKPYFYSLFLSMKKKKNSRLLKRLPFHVWFQLNAIIPYTQSTIEWNIVFVFSLTPHMIHRNRNHILHVLLN